MPPLMAEARKVAALVPPAVGLKDTSMVQVARKASLLRAQSFAPNMKSPGLVPTSETEMRLEGILPLFCTVKMKDAAVDPTGALP